MAIYISIRKVSESKEFAKYTFSTTDGREGVLSLSKDDGSVVLLTPMPGDVKKDYFARASHKIKKHWENGDLPEKTSWAS